MAITQPETGDFWHGARVEAEYQRQQWEDTDPEKSDADWFWTLSYIVGKVLWPGISREKKFHRIEAAAGMLYNWHEKVKAQPSSHVEVVVNHNDGIKTIYTVAREQINGG